MGVCDLPNGCSNGYSAIWGEPAISLPDIYQRSFNAIGDKATAGKLVAILEDHGWRSHTAGPVVAGQRRRDAWGSFGVDDERLSQIQRRAAKAGRCARPT
jgi:hypothetical protein